MTSSTMTEDRGSQGDRGNISPLSQGKAIGDSEDHVVVLDDSVPTNNIHLPHAQTTVPKIQNPSRVEHAVNSVNQPLSHGVVDVSQVRLLAISLQRIRKEASTAATSSSKLQRAIHASVVKAIDKIGIISEDHAEVSVGFADKYWLPMKIALLPDSSPQLKEVVLYSIQKLLAYNLITGEAKLDDSGLRDELNYAIKHATEQADVAEGIADSIVGSVFSFFGSNASASSAARTAEESGNPTLGRHLLSLRNIDGSLPGTIFDPVNWATFHRSMRSTGSADISPHSTTSHDDKNEASPDFFFSSSMQESLKDEMPRICQVSSGNGASNSSTTGTYLIDDIVGTICKSIGNLGTGPPLDDLASAQPKSNTTNEATSSLHIQVLKVLLTTVTSTTCEVHGFTLLAIVQTCFNIYMYSKSNVSSVTAKASLIQIINIAFSRAQMFCQTLEHAIASGTIDKGYTHPDTVQGPKSDLNDETQEIRDRTKTETSTNRTRDTQESNFNSALLLGHYFVSPTDPTKFNPYRPCMQFYYVLLKIDVYLLFRLLCRISYTKNLDPIITPGSSDATYIAGSDLAAGSQNEHEISVGVVAVRKLSLELIMTVFSGSIFYEDDLYTDLVRKYFCRSVAINGISTNPQLFELSISLFMQIIRFFRNKVKSEIEILLDSIYLHILEMDNSTYKQKSVVLQAVLLLCEDPQTIMDIFVNYDCDMEMASLCDHIITACSKIGQNNKTEETTHPSYLDIVGLGSDSKDKLLRMEGKRLRVQSLQCLAAIVKSLLSWSKPLDFISNDTDAQLLSCDSQVFERDNVGEILSVQLSKRKSVGSISTHLSFTEALSATGQPTPVVITKNPLTTITFTDVPPSSNAPTLESLRSGRSYIEHSIPYKGFGGKHERTYAPGNNSPPEGTGYGTPDQESNNESTQLVEAISSRKQDLKRIIALFNEKPKQGMKMAESRGFVSTSDLPSIVHFLRSNPSLSKTSIGEYLGEGDTINVQVMRLFIDSFDFANMDFVPALRSLLQTFRLPGEAQKIDRIVEKFADRYCETNPNVFANADAAYTLAFSVIMLNTDQHSPQVKHRMDVQDFIKNNRGINDNGDFPDDFLSAVFNDIRNNEIVMEEDRSSGNLAQIAITWGAGDVTDKQRMDFYNKEISLVTKKTQQLMESHESRSVNPFRPAVASELARPFFGIHCFAMMAVFSKLLSTCPDIKTLSDSADSKQNAEPDVALICLQGLVGSIKLACIFKMEAERDALMEALSRMTKLTQLLDFKQKNLMSLKMLLAVGVLYGEYLGSSWVYVLRAISLQELLNGMNSKSPTQRGERSTDAKNVLAAVASSLSLVSHFAGNDSSDGNLGQAELRTKSDLAELVSGTSDLAVDPVRSPNATTFAYPGSIDELVSANNNVNDLLDEIHSQGSLLIVDKIFTSTAKFSPHAIVSFFQSLCIVSVEEAGISPDCLLKGKPIEIVVEKSPRTYLMQKVAEIAHYNITRIRYEWSQIWKVLQPYFNLMGCHPNLSISVFAIDSLRQLSMKFFEKEELGHFSSQNDFLRGFELIMRTNENRVIKELILSSIERIIVRCSGNLRSGWKSIFIVLARAAEGNGRQQVIVQNSMELMQVIFKKHMPAVISAGCFVDYVSSVSKFALLPGTDATNVDEVASTALALLSSCANKLAEERPAVA